MPEIKAQLRNLRVAPRKVRLVSGLIKGLGVSEAKNQLHHLAKRSAQPMLKLINSASANAQNNFGLDENNLFIKDLTVDEGRKLKRFRPKGFGSSSPIQKKTSHINIVLGERFIGLKNSQAARVETKEEVAAEAPESQPRQESQSHRNKIKPEIKKELNMETRNKSIFGGIKNTGRKLFRRKAI